MKLVQNLLGTFFLGVLWFSAPVLADDGVLSGTANTVHHKYNEVARMLNKPQRLELQECTKTSNLFCKYVLNGQQIVSARSTKNVDEIRDIVVFVSPTRQPRNMVATLRILMTAYSQNSTASDIDRGIEKITAVLNKQRKEISFSLGGTKYTVNDLGPHTGEVTVMYLQAQAEQ